ncbi:MAG: calcium/sodium antiporter [Planctomycetota bacterium]
MFLSLIYLVIGLVLLVKGADVLVEASAALARAIGIPASVVGLTIVAFGTSAPEMASGIAFTLSDRSEVVIGTVVGSNIANVALILGVTALVRPIPCRRAFTAIEVPLMIGASVLSAALMVDGRITVLEGIGLLLFVAAYIAKPTSDAEELGREVSESQPDEGPGAPRWALRMSLIVLGIAGLTFGSQLLISGAETLARAAGVPEFVIGLSLVAIGTSLPELATAVRAAMKGHSDIAVGNVIGSNVFNLLGVVGVSAVFAPLAVPTSVLGRDLLVMLGLALACLPIMVTGRRINRSEGFLLLSVYLGYVTLLYLTRDA